MEPEYVCDEQYRDLIPEGIYEAYCFGFNRGFCVGKARKLFLTFKIINSGKYDDKEFFLAFNMPANGKVRPGSKYYKTWVMVNKWQKPSRNAQLSPRLFLQRVFKVKMRTVTPEHNGKKMPEHFRYSVVDQIVEVCA